MSSATFDKLSDILIIITTFGIWAFVLSKLLKSKRKKTERLLIIAVATLLLIPFGIFTAILVDSVIVTPVSRIAPQSSFISCQRLNREDCFTREDCKYVEICLFGPDCHYECVSKDYIRPNEKIIPPPSKQE